MMSPAPSSFRGLLVAGLLVSSVSVFAEDASTGNGSTDTGLAPTPPGSTSTTTPAQTLVNSNLDTSRQLYDTSFLAGSDRVTYGTVDPVNPNFSLEGLNQPSASNGKLSLSEANRIAKMPLAEAFPNHKAGPTEQSGTAAMHPMQVLAAMSINWLAVLFSCLGLFCLAVCVLSFMHTHDFAALIRRVPHWMALGALSAIMTFIVW